MMKSFLAMTAGKDFFCFLHVKKRAFWDKVARDARFFCL